MWCPNGSCFRKILRILAVARWDCFIIDSSRCQAEVWPHMMGTITFSCRKNNYSSLILCAYTLVSSRCPHPRIISGYILLTPLRPPALPVVLSRIHGCCNSATVQVLPCPGPPPDCWYELKFPCIPPMAFTKLACHRVGCFNAGQLPSRGTKIPLCIWAH